MKIKFYEAPPPVREACLFVLIVSAFAAGSYMGHFQSNPKWKMQVFAILVVSSTGTVLAKRFFPVVSVSAARVTLSNHFGLDKSIALTDIQAVTLRDGVLSIEIENSQPIESHLAQLSTEQQQEAHTLLLKRIAAVRSSAER